MEQTRLASFIEGICKSKDVAAAEVGAFVVELSAHRSSTPYWDFLALLGTALSNPEAFAQQPLTHCPPGASVQLEEAAFERGLRALRNRAVGVRAWCGRSGFSPEKGRSPADDPQAFCKGAASFLELPRKISKDYQLAIGLVLLVLTFEFTGELGADYWDAADADLGELLQRCVLKQREAATKQLAERIMKGQW
jgi:hypothetical protein